MPGSGQVQVSAAEQGRGAVPHFQLKQGQVLEMRRMITGEGVAADIRYPVGEPRRAAQCQPAVLPVAGYPDSSTLQAFRLADWHHAPAACLAGAGVNQHPLFVQLYIIGAQACHLVRSQPAVQHEVQRGAHGPVLGQLSGLFQFFHLLQGQGHNLLLLHPGHLDIVHGVGIAPSHAPTIGKDAV